MIGTSVLALLFVGFIGLSVRTRKPSIRNIDESSGIQTSPGAAAFMEARGNILQPFVNAMSEIEADGLITVACEGNSLRSENLRTSTSRATKTELLQTETQHV
jgi:hypothetical protein